MKRLPIITLSIVAIAAIITSCEPKAPSEDSLFIQPGEVENLLNPGDKIFHLEEFLDTFMTEKGNYVNDSTPYRTNSHGTGEYYFFTIDTIPSAGRAIYIRGRIATDDYGGNFYKSLVLQEIVGGKQQSLRVSVDMGSVNGMYEMGQEVLIRCNGLAVGRYANQPQLCRPSYNNNLYAIKNTTKVGWDPGRIPSAIFRKITYMVGFPDVSKLQYDTITINDFEQYADEASMDKIRKMDGSLVVIKDIYFTGEYMNSSTYKFAKCDSASPEVSEYANVFAPTTENINFPQGRVISDGTNRTIVSTSEFAKYARYYLPGADKDGVTNCPNYKGSVTGILGYYQDKATDEMNKMKWAISLRNIGINSNIKDLKLYDAAGNEWVPEEWTPVRETTTEE